jgi:hypothetical protein
MLRLKRDNFVRMGSWLCLLALCTSASAQAAPGDHVRAGGAELTPSLSFLTEWRSNVYLVETAAQSGLNLQVVPKIGLKLNGSNVDLAVDGQYRARYYTNSNLDNLNDFTEADVKLDLDVGKTSVVGFKVDDGFSIKTQATEATYAKRALTTVIKNDATGAMTIRPGGALALDVGGRFSYQNIFTPDEASLAKRPGTNLNSKTHYGPTVRMKWTFFPKTAFVANYAYSRFDWAQNLVVAKGDNTGTDVIGDWLAIPDGVSHRAWGGLFGRFTERLVLNLSGGYARMTYDEASVVNYAGKVSLGAGDAEVNAETVGFGADATGMPDSLLVVAELEWSPSIASMFTAGYRKDISDSWFTNYVAYHYSFLRYKGLLGSRLGIEGEFGFRAEKYVGEVNRSDQLIRAEGGLAYKASRFIQVGLNGFWTRRLSPGSPLAEYDDIGGTVELSFNY